MKRTMILVGLLLLVVTPIFVFRLSPHGGIVFSWQDTTGMHKFSGGGGETVQEAIVISNASLDGAKDCEID